MLTKGVKVEGFTIDEFPKTFLIRKTVLIGTKWKEFYASVTLRDKSAK